MLSRSGAAAAFLALAFSTLLPVHAQPAAGDLGIALTMRKVETGTDGKEVLKETAAVKPGDVLEYVAVYTNKGKQPLSSIQATLPIPVGTVYQLTTSQPAGAQASTDGKTYAAQPLQRRVVDKDGKAQLVAVPANEYRSLRWVIPKVDPGKSVEVRARARVEQASPVTVGAASQAAPAR